MIEDSKEFIKKSRKEERFRYEQKMDGRKEGFQKSQNLIRK